jgi:hypothetical protein
MHSFKVAIVLVTCFTAATIVAQQSAPAQNQSPDTSLASTPTPQNSAQSQRRAPSPDKQTKHLAKQLGLNRDQVAQIRPIIAERDQQIAQLRSNTILAPRDRRARMMAIQQSSATKIEALLNESQKQQFEQITAERRNRVRHSPKA